MASRVGQDKTPDSWVSLETTVRPEVQKGILKNFYNKEKLDKLSRNLNFV